MTESRRLTALLGHARLAFEIVATAIVVRLRLRSQSLPAAMERLRAKSARSDAPYRPQVHHSAARKGEAVHRALTLPLIGVSCLTQSMVLASLLERRSIPNSLVIGVRSGEKFGAHAWVEYHGRALLPDHGGEYERLAEF